jgi:hypothetical protein
MKRVLKGFVLFVASSLYAWLLFATASGVALRQTFIEPATTKTWLADSGVYANIVSEVSKLATIQQKQENSLVQITAEDIQTTAKDAFPADSMQVDGEKIVDGFYGWFRGQTSGPEFQIDFASRQATFARLMRGKLETKILALPECATASRFEIQAFDPFKAECRPKGVDLTSELDSFEKDLSSSKSLLPQTTYNGGDIKVADTSGKSDRIGTVLSWVPMLYRGLKYGPILLAVLTVLSALTMIFLSTSRRKGLGRFAGGLLFTGVILLLSGFFLRPAFEKLNSFSTKFLGSQASFTQNIIDPVFYEANKTFSRYSVIFGVGYVVPALLAYAVLMLTKHKDDNDEADERQPPNTHLAVPQEPHTSVLEHTGDMAQTENGVQDMQVATNDHIPEQHYAQPLPMSQPVAQPEPAAEPAIMPQATTAIQSIRPTPRIIARPSSRPVTRRSPMIQG